MAARPEPLADLDRYFAAATIAHELIADLHRELVGRGLANERTRSLLTESAAVITTEMPGLTRAVRSLESRWNEQRVLDPEGAGGTLDQIARMMERLAGPLRELRRRQDEIASELSGLLPNRNG